MPKTETQTDNLKINRGTYAKIQENIAQISENELIITTDKNIPVPTENDNGKVIKVVNGDYSLEQDATGGTVTSVSVSMNGTTKGTVTTSGTIDLGTVLTSHQSLDSCVKLDGGTLGQTISSTVDTPVYLKSGTPTSYIGFKKSNGSIVGTIGFGGPLYQRPVFSLGSDSTLYQLAKYNDIPTNNNQLTNGAGYITSSALTGYATQTWVGQQGYLTSSALTGYATQTWVGQQGYLTSSALTGYATQTWVNNQGFLKSHQTLKTINSNSIVGSGNINVGTVTNVAVKMNGSVKGTVTSSGTIDLGTVITSHQSLSNYPTLNGNNTFTGKNIFSGSVDSISSANGIQLGVDDNVNANMSIISSGFAQYIDFGKPNTDYNFRLIKWYDGYSSNLFQMSYGGSDGSYTINVPKKTGTMCVVSSFSGGTLALVG